MNGILKCCMNQSERTFLHSIPLNFVLFYQYSTLQFVFIVPLCRFIDIDNRNIVLFAIRRYKLQLIRSKCFCSLGKKELIRVEFIIPIRPVIRKVVILIKILSFIASICFPESIRTLIFWRQLMVWLIRKGVSTLCQRDSRFIPFRTYFIISQPLFGNFYYFCLLFNDFHYGKWIKNSFSEDLLQKMLKDIDFKFGDKVLGRLYYLRVRLWFDDAIHIL